MQDDLLVGYLLGALEPDEMLEVEREVRSSPRLRARLEQLEAMLEPLQKAKEHFEPPGDLVERTLAVVDQGACPIPAISPSQEASAVTRSRTDVLMAVACGLALLALLFPTLYQTREQARTAVCADQLRELGMKLIQFAAQAPNQRFPALEQSGREAFAGVYAVRLKGAGLLEEEHLVWCPAGPDFGNIPAVPERSLLLTADEPLLASLQQSAGGRYAYNLGYLENGRFVAPRTQHRSTFAIMSDVLEDDDVTPHPGVLNVLYEDGRVSRHTLHMLGVGRDHPLVNRVGRSEAGLDENDAVLAPSPAPPFVWVDQR